MIRKTEARIYPAHMRGCTQTESFRSYQILNPGNYFQQLPAPLGKLLEFTDDTLSGHFRMNVPVNAGTTVLIIPVVGSVKYTLPFASGIAEAGTCHIIPVISTSMMELHNPFEEELINVLRIHLAGLPQAAQPIAIPLVLESFGRPVQLSSHHPDDVTNGFIVKLRGREDNIHRMRKSSGGLFAFVVEGTVEVEGRLLDPRDGLALWGMETVEFEALTAEAIVIFLELSEGILH